MLLRAILLIPFALQTVKCDKNIIPVFLIDHSGAMGDFQVDANPFHKMSTAQFADIVQVSIKKAAVIIVFIEDQFCAEDISTKDLLGTPYRHLRKALTEDKVKYFPKVIEPFKLLNQVFQPHQFNVFHLSTGMNFDMLEGKLKHLYVFFRDGKNETRVEKLRRHDEIMREVYTVMTKLAEGPVLAFYTGKMNPLQVDKVDFVPILPNPGHSLPGVTVITDGALFWFFGVYAVTPTRRALFSQMPILAEETWTDQALSTKMAYSDFDLEFNFKFRESGWLLENVMLFEGGEEVGRTNMLVSAPWYHAYYCGEPMVVINNRDGSSVTISEYKIQAVHHRRRFRCGSGRGGPQTKSRKGRKPPSSSDAVRRRADFKMQTKTVNNETIIALTVDGIFTKRRESHSHRRQEANGNYGDDDSDTTTTTKSTLSEGSGDDDNSECGFGSTVNCGPYFSAGILSALFVVGICLLMLGFGLVAISDCKTNDRYDDPRGKILVLGMER